MKQEYLKATNLYEEAERRYKEITFRCQGLQKRIEQYPAGVIHVVKKGERTQYYLRSNSKDKSGDYILKKDIPQIRCFLQKKYDEKIYRLLKTEQDSLKKFLQKSENISKQIRLIYSDYPKDVKEQIMPVDISDEDFCNRWLNEPYVGKEIDSDLPVFVTNNGERVRSKSELNIANMLEKRNIPYKYEYPLPLSNGRIIYPDFTVLNVKIRKIFYWEHRGMMDDREYLKHTVQRIKTLSKEGIMLGDNLIISEETQNCPLGTDEINDIIEKWFVG